MKFEEYMLVILGEEAQELIEAVNAILQNGLHEIRQDSKNETNKHHFLVEYYHLKTVMEELFDKEILNDLDLDSKHSLRAFQRFRTDMEVEREYKISQTDIDTETKKSYKILPMGFLIIEKAVTIAHKVNKSLRFSIHAFHPKDPEYTNAIAIVNAYHQLCMIFGYAVYNDMLENLSEEEIKEITDKKLAADKASIEKAIMLGTLTNNY